MHASECLLLYNTTLKKLVVGVTHICKILFNIVFIGIDGYFINIF